MSDEDSPLEASDRQLAGVLSKLDAGGGKRSALYLWLRERHDALAARFERRRAEGLGGPNWPALVAEFAALGLVDATGKPPTLRGAQQTWYRVVRDVKRARGARARNPSPPPSPPPAHAKAAPGVRPGTPPPNPSTPVRTVSPEAVVPVEPLPAAPKLVLKPARHLPPKTEE